MYSYSIDVQRTPSADNSLLWHLDYPFKGEIIDSSELIEEGLLVQGWLLSDSKSPISLVILNGVKFIELPISSPRNDVISKVLGDSSENHPQLYCGFSEKVKLRHPVFSIGVVQDGHFTQLLSGSVEGKFQVLKGEGDWLFLDNDTNKSVEQHTGKLKLSRITQLQWKDYLNSLDRYARSNSMSVCLLIAPSKEMVYEKFYPHKLSKDSPVNKLAELVPDTLNFVFPVKDLQNLELRSFRVCDTHWTLHGAKLASQLVTTQLTAKNLNYLQVFEGDKYRARQVSGDLGSKLYPPQFHEEDSLVSFNYRQKVIFDNNIENFGRVICIFNSEALIEKSLLLFGSSSSYTMFHYISRLYRNVTFVHTAGSIDHEVIEFVKPDHMCLQTNARFVVKAPKFNDSITRYIELKKKIGAITAPTIAKALPEECKTYIEYFIHMLD